MKSKGFYSEFVSVGGDTDYHFGRFSEHGLIALVQALGAQTDKRLTLCKEIRDNGALELRIVQNFVRGASVFLLRGKLAIDLNADVNRLDHNIFHIDFLGARGDDLLQRTAELILHDGVLLAVERDAEGGEDLIGEIPLACHDVFL